MLAFHIDFKFTANIMYELLYELLYVINVKLFVLCISGS